MFQYALEVYSFYQRKNEEREPSWHFSRQIDVLNSVKECIELANKKPNECDENEEFYITEIEYDENENEIGTSRDRLIDCL